MERIELIKSAIQLLTQLGIFGIAAYYIQKQIDHSSQKRLEEFKSTLNLISNKGIKLHEKRLLVIEELYAKLVDVEIAMLWLTHPVKIAPSSPAEYEKNLLNDAVEKYSSFAQFYDKNKIYFNASLCTNIEVLRNTLNVTMINYNEHKLFTRDEVGRETYVAARQKMLDAYKTVKDTIPALRNNLETEFRKILAVE